MRSRLSPSNAGIYGAVTLCLPSRTFNAKSLRRWKAPLRSSPRPFEQSALPTVPTSLCFYHPWFASVLTRASSSLVGAMAGLSAPTPSTRLPGGVSGRSRQTLRRADGHWSCRRRAAARRSGIHAARLLRAVLQRSRGHQIRDRHSFESRSAHGDRSESDAIRCPRWQASHLSGVDQEIAPNRSARTRRSPSTEAPVILRTPAVTRVWRPKRCKLILPVLHLLDG